MPHPADPSLQPRPAHATAARTISHAGASPRAWLVLLAVTFLGLAADLTSKHWAFRAIGPRPVEIRRADVLNAPSLASLIPDGSRRVAIPRVLDFQLVLNPGSVFGIGAGKRWFFIAVTPLAVGFALWMFARWTTPREWPLHAAAGLILAGGLGNLYDRLVFACVRDFLHPLPGWRLPFGWSWPWGGREIWPYVSNVADAFLLIGVALFLFRLLRPHPHHAHNSPATS